MNDAKLQAEILANAQTEEEYSLERLQYWLQYGKHSWSLGAGIIWFTYGLILRIVKILAIVFTPFMLWHLFKAKWYKSIVVFLAVVAAPYVTFLFIHVENRYLEFVFMVLPVLTFYFYTYIISYMIGDYLAEIKTLKKWKYEEKLRNSS
ncbi:MAG TPA: hypothetical protein VJ991_01125 [Balneolales bacterium]|nr:hypothetical protein [Balneolales bacterium]